MARRLGLGDRLDFDIPSEGTGLIPDRAWKTKRYKQPWHQGETLNTSIGQGHVLATPLQLATMTARLVNGGRAVKPVLVRSVESEGSRMQDWPDIQLNQNHLQIVMKGMAAVTNGSHGTAYAARITEPGLEMGGKSGTAQVRRITAQMRAQGVKNEDLPWKFRHHALFVAYAPLDKPKYVTAIIVEHGVGGSSAAAPIARDLLLMAQKRDPRKIHTVDDAIEKAVEAGEQKENGL
jgi:penicillin-binding protein 2